MDYSDTEFMTWPVQLTQGLHRGIYPLLDPARPEQSAKGKNVVITGVSGGVGRVIAEAWCIAGADAVVISGRNVQELESVSAKISLISKNTKVLVIPADLTSETSVAEFWDKTIKDLGAVHVLINDAATMNLAPSGEIEPSLWWRDFEVNVKGNYLMSHHFIKHGKGRGTVINISSGAAGISAPGLSSYIPSKLAQTKMSEIMQLDHPELRVFTILPGILVTAMTAAPFMPFAKDDPMLSGGLSLFLCTPRADWLKGQVVSVNWDLEEMEKHKDEITNEGLAKLSYLGAKLGKGGHPWKS